MRILIANFVLMCALLSAALSQQADSPKDQPNQKKPAAQPAKNEKKPPESATKPPETPAAEEHKPDLTASDKDKEEHYDVTEVAPVVTRHQITVDGKLLKYTATAGRLPIKRE